MPSIFDKMMSMFKGGKREPSIRELQEGIQKRGLVLQKRLLESQLNWWTDMVDPKDPLWDDPDFWNPMWNGQYVPPTLNNTLRGDLLPVYINWFGLKLIRDYSRQQYQFNPYAYCAIENRCSYIAGKGFQYKLVPNESIEDYGDEDVKELCKLGQHWIDEFTASQRWNEREHEIIMRGDRDGEAFARFFHIGQGKTAVRFIEPEWVQGPSEADYETYGIENEPGDVEDVLNYWVTEHPPAQVPVKVPAEEVIHFKLNSDSNCKRGLPTLYGVRLNLARADRLLRNLSVLVQVRATFAMIRKWTQTSPSSIGAWQQSNSDVTAPNFFTGGNQYSKQYNAGTVLDVPANVEYDFPHASTDVGGCVAVLKEELRAIAAKLVQPEYMISADPSNANYASYAVAESPSVKNFERLQCFYARRFGDGRFGSLKSCGAMWKVVANAVEYGGLPRAILRYCTLQVEGPSLIARNKDAESARWEKMNEKDVLSKDTWSKYEGLNRDQEKKKIKVEKEEALATDAQLELEKQKAQAVLAVQQQVVQQQAVQYAAAQGVALVPPAPQVDANGQPVQQQPGQAPGQPAAGATPAGGGETHAGAMTGMRDTVG